MYQILPGAAMESLLDGAILRHLGPHVRERTVAMIHLYLEGSREAFGVALRQSLSHALSAFAWGMVPVHLHDTVWDRWLTQTHSLFDSDLSLEFVTQLQSHILEPLAVEHNLFDRDRVQFQEEIVGLCEAYIQEISGVIPGDLFADYEWSALMSGPPTMSITPCLVERLGAVRALTPTQRDLFLSTGWLGDAMLSWFCYHLQQQKSIVRAKEALCKEGYWLAPTTIHETQEQMSSSLREQIEHLQERHGRLMDAVQENEEMGLLKHAERLRLQCEGIERELQGKQRAFECLPTTQKPLQDALDEWQQTNARLVHFEGLYRQWFFSFAPHSDAGMEAIIEAGIGAAWRVEHLPDVQGLPELLEQLTSGSVSVRREAAVALGESIDRVVTEALVRALQDEDAGVRWRAAEALGRHGRRTSVPALLNMLQDPDRHVRWVSAHALGQLQDARAFDVLCEALLDEYSYVRWHAAEALGHLGDRRAVRSLARLFQDDSVLVRRGAARALGELRDPQARAQLREAMKDPDESVRESAYEALRRLPRC